MAHLARIPRIAVRSLIGSIALAGLLAGCGPGATPIMSYTCGTVPAAACFEQAQMLEAAATGPVRMVAISCMGENCTRARGAGGAKVTLADATSSSHTWSYTGDPNPPPTPTCVGLASAVCLQRVQELTGDVSPSHHLVSVRLTCTAVCDAAGGELVAVFLSEGGLKDEIGTSWGAQRP